MAEVPFWTGVLDATVSAGTVLILAALGEIISERAGIINIGIEGIMLVGALTGFVTTVITGNPYVGFGAAAVAGTAVAAIHAFFCISLKSDQVISGFMITLLGVGVTTYLGKSWVTENVEGFREVTLPIVGPYLIGIPLLGPAMFQNPATDYITIGLIPVVWYLLNRSNLGLEINAVGESPETADSLGVNVTWVRYVAVLLGGAFMGAAGGHLALAFSKLWVPNMVAGRGWIALALVIFAQWRAERVIIGGYLFALITALEIRSQGLSLNMAWLPGALESVVDFLLNPLVMGTYPYLVTIIVLVLISRRGITYESSAPTAILEPYLREED